MIILKVVRQMEEEKTNTTTRTVYKIGIKVHMGAFYSNSEGEDLWQSFLFTNTVP